MAENVGVFDVSDDAMNAIREYVRSNIAYARYQVGSSWYRADIQEAVIMADGRISVSFMIDHTVAGNITVTGIELYNHNGVRWGGMKTSIRRSDAQEGILYRIRFSVVEKAA